MAGFFLSLLDGKHTRSTSLFSSYFPFFVQPRVAPFNLRRLDNLCWIFEVQTEGVLNLPSLGLAGGGGEFGGRVLQR